MRTLLLLLFLCLAPTLLPAQSNYFNEFWPSAGYNRIRGDQFFDAGLRWYHLRPDGQLAMAFAGTAAGCEFSFDRPSQVYIPYLGWQGQVLMVGYGLRAEYATDREQRSFGCTVETGLSFIEMLRVTGGYRAVFSRHDPLKLRGFRFSVILALPIEWGKLLKPESDDDDECR